MNFLKKLALATSLGTIFQYHSPDSAYTNAFLTHLRQEPIQKPSFHCYFPAVNFVST